MYTKNHVEQLGKHISYVAMCLYLDRSFQQRPITEWVKFTSLKCMNMLLSNINISELSHYLVNHYYDHHVGITSAAEKGLKNRWQRC